jgi:hypothetical protein
MRMNGNRSATARAWVTRVVTVGLFCLLVDGCTKTPTQTGDTALPTGGWTGDGACLSVTLAGCDLVVGCGHGQFPPPVVRADGTFEVDGTYRVEAGPITINPAPPAIFSGLLRGRTLMLSVAPIDQSPRPASYVLQLTHASGKCAVPCV